MTDYYVTTSGNDSNAGTSEGAAFATIGKAGSVALSDGDRIYVKSGTYVLASDTPDVAGGVAVLRQGVYLIGYESTIDDNCPTGNRPVFDASSFSTFTNNVGLINVHNPNYSHPHIQIKNMHLLGVLGLNGTTSGRPRAGISGVGAWQQYAVGTSLFVDNCVIEGFYHAIEKYPLGSSADKRVFVYNSYLNDNVLPFNGEVGLVKDCFIRNFFGVASIQRAEGCVIEYFGDGAISFFGMGLSSEHIKGCVVLNHGTYASARGFLSSGTIEDSITIGFPVAVEVSATGGNFFSRNCFSFGETTLIDYSVAAHGTDHYLEGFTSLTQDPFVDSANLDLTIRDTVEIRQNLGVTNTMRDGLARGINWYRKPTDGTKPHPLDF